MSDCVCGHPAINHAQRPPRLCLACTRCGPDGPNDVDPHVMERCDCLGLEHEEED